VPVFNNLLWIIKSAPGGGDGSLTAPFNTITAAVLAAPANASTTLMVSADDYSGEAEVVITDQDLALQGLGGAAAGAGTPAGRTVLPALRFAASTGTLTFFARNVETGTCTVETLVSATLENCTSTWADAGGLLTVRASGQPETFTGTPQQTISGTCGVALLEGIMPRA
jgi:hypothetical protein